MASTPNYYRPGDPLDKLVPFLCPTCGGINDARQYTLLRVAMLASMPCKKCECQIGTADLVAVRECLSERLPEIRHDGQIGSYLDSSIAVEWHELPYRNVRVISLCQPMRSYEHEKTYLLHFTPAQALSLLAWLEQERSEMEMATKEQEHA